MHARGTGHRTQDRSTALIHCRQHGQMRKRNLARLPWWRHPPVGYLVTFPLVGLGLLIPFGLQRLGIANAFLDTPFVLVKDHFLSMASHELKTPITSIRGEAQLAMRRLTKQAELPAELAPLRTALERIDQQTHRLQSLVDDLLDLSILRSGKMSFRSTRCDVGEVCRGVIAEQQALASRSIGLEVPSSPVVLQADCERLSQVVTNLVTNALKYSPENSPVQVRVSQSKHSALIQVHNEGSTIPQEQQANIFEPFYRTPDAQSSSKKGWGLGLAISKQIVERHGGRIGVESSQEKGVTFRIELPFFLDEPSEGRA